MLLIIGSSFVSCGDDDDNEKDNIENNGGSNSGGSNSGGGSSTEYSLDQMSGYWVNSEQWNECCIAIRILSAASQSSETILNDRALSNGVEGYYITKEGRAYQMLITVTTTKYSNNDVAGNKVLKSWSCYDGKTVYFMNVEGSKYNYSCSIDGSMLSINNGKWNYMIQNASAIVYSDNVRYEKVTL